MPKKLEGKIAVITGGTEGIGLAIDPNVITISIQPDEGISIAFDAKRPGTQVRTVTVQANFSYQASLGSKGPVALRDSAARLDAWRCNAIYAPGRSRGGVAHHFADRRSMGTFTGARLPPTMVQAARDHPRGMNCSWNAQKRRRRHKKMELDSDRKANPSM